MSRRRPHQQALNNDSCSENTTKHTLPHTNMSSLPLVQSTLHFNTDSSAYPRDMGSFVLDLWVFFMSACLFFQRSVLMSCLCNSLASLINKKSLVCAHLCVFVWILKGEGGKRAFRLVLGEMGSGVSGLAEPGWLSRQRGLHPPKAPGALPAGKPRPIKRLTTRTVHKPFV